MKWTIAVPSYGRAGMVTTDRVLPEAVIAVHESQIDEYRKACPTPANGGRYHVLPDLERGNIAKARNLILDAFPGNVIMADDDYDSFCRMTHGQSQEMGPEDIERVIFRGFTMAADVGTPLWGVNVQADPKFYREYTPITFLSPVLGPFSAHMDNPLRYDEDLWLKEDFDMSLQVLRKYHRVLRFNMYHYRVDHYETPGGVVGYRSWDEEIRQLRRLQEKWGNEVVRFDVTKSVNPVLRVPLRGV